MADKIYEELDPLTGRIKRWEFDGEHIIQRTSQDVAPLLDQNAVLRNDASVTAFGKKRGMLKVGSIPLELVQKWKAEEGFDIMSPSVPTSEVLKRLRMAEFEKLRTTDVKF